MLILIILVLICFRAFADDADSNQALKMRRTGGTKDPRVERAVTNWFCAQRADGVPLSGPMIQTQALQISAQLNPDAPEGSFLASRGWLQKWQRRHGVRSVQIAGEARSADLAAAEEFLPRLQALVEEEDYSPEQVFNADETALYWRMTPGRTLAQRSDPNATHGHKQSKDRVTVLLATNWAGDCKVKPLVIGKFGKPRCFATTKMSSLPVQYTNSSNAWMTASIFLDWFKKTFVPTARRHLRSLGLPERGVLLLDNCPAHPPAASLVSRDGQFKVFYLPKNTTSKIQPLDQGIIATVKRDYRKSLIRAVLDEATTITEFLRTLTLKDACYLLGSAWDSVTPSSIRKTWDSALGNPFDHPVSEEEAGAEFLGFTEQEVEEACARAEASAATFEQLLTEWAECGDEEEPICAPLTLDDLLAPQPEPEPEPEPEPAPQLPTNKTVLDGLEAALVMFEHLGETHRVSQLRSMIRETRKRINMAGRQTSISSYTCVQ